MSRRRTLASFSPLYFDIAQGFLDKRFPNSELVMKFPTKGGAINFRQQFYMFRNLLDEPTLRDSAARLTLIIRESQDTLKPFEVFFSTTGGRGDLFDQLTSQLIEPSPLQPEVPIPHKPKADPYEQFLTSGTQPPVIDTTPPAQAFTDDYMLEMLNRHTPAPLDVAQLVENKKQELESQGGNIANSKEQTK